MNGSFVSGDNIHCGDAERPQAALPPFAAAVDPIRPWSIASPGSFCATAWPPMNWPKTFSSNLHKNWARIESPAHMVYWLRKVATHRAIDAARKRKAKAETSLEETDEPTVSGTRA